MLLWSLSIHDRFEKRVLSVFVKLDIDLCPKIIGEVVQLPAG
jgi:hypothetical protein